MKGFVLASLLIVAVSASLTARVGSEFEAFKLKHSKSYLNQVEEAKRLTIFAKNLQEIEEHNARFDQGLETYKKGINQFADWTHEEFKAYLRLYPNPSFAKSANVTPYVKTGVAVPESKDWRTEDYVAEVKNQGNCGSCWAFSVIGSTEGAYKKKSGQLVSLSEQQLVDCTTDINAGCDGGYLDLTFPYIQRTGLQSESSYPYTAQDGTCKFSESQVVTKVSNYVGWSGDEAALLEVVGSIGPVSVAIDADYISLYSSGIFSDKQCTQTQLDHGVLIVGYGTQDGTDYWIVKNSWGAEFGENGYIKMLRGVNHCGIADDTVYPVIN